MKRIHLVTDDGLYKQKVKIVFNHPVWMMVNLSVI